MRYGYIAVDVIGIAVSHHNLGNCLRLYACQPTGALAHHLAAALICALAGAEGVDRSVYAAASDLRASGAGANPPMDVADLCRQVAGVPGTDLDQLLTALVPDLDATQQILRELTARALALADASPTTDRRHLAAWDPVIAAVLAADGGDTQAAAAVDAELDRYQDSADWGALVAALRRLRTGETGPGLLTGLDDVDTAIVTRALDAHDGKITIRAGLWPL